MTPPRKRVVHIAALDLTVQLSRELTPGDLPRVLAELRADIAAAAAERPPKP